MSVNKIIAAAAVLAMSAFSAQADSPLKSAASSTVRILGVVPVLCRVNLSMSLGVIDENGIAELGTAQEFCNAPRGYRVLVQHPAGLTGAAVISNGERIPLSPTGETVISDISHAAIRAVALSADLGDEPHKFSALSIRIEARA